ncbi:MAG: hypothetical protein FJ280_12255, partial [Planctomycetes bacterium]|nr:hypothetical protein [Planctomycetota bacterium]
MRIDMDVAEIKRMGRPLGTFLGEFDDCFGRSEPREHLRTYVQGQLSDLPRKSIEPIALAQIAHALGNGIRVRAWTFDELYGRGREFLDGVSAVGQNFVGEIPRDFTGWLQEPRVLRHPGRQEKPKGGRKRRYPRLSRQALPACEVRNLAPYSPVFRKQQGQKFRIKDGEKGPIVWEVEHATFYRKHGPDGLP